MQGSGNDRQFICQHTLGRLSWYSPRPFWTSSLAHHLPHSPAHARPDPGHMLSHWKNQKIHSEKSNNTYLRFLNSLGVDRYKAVNQHRERKTVRKKKLIKKSRRKEMETPCPPNGAQLCGALAAFLERGPAAPRTEHLDWDCFLNRFFLVCIFHIF